MQQCSHQWDCKGPIDGIVYQRCKVRGCGETKCSAADGKNLIELHPAQEGGPLSPWWASMNNFQRHVFYEKNKEGIIADVREHGVRKARAIWGFSSSGTFFSALKRWGESAEARAPERPVAPTVTAEIRTRLEAMKLAARLDDQDPPGLCAYIEALEWVLRRIGSENNHRQEHGAEGGGWELP